MGDKEMRRPAGLLACTALGALSLALAAPAAAQDTADTTDGGEAADSQSDSEILVTGSRIRGINVAGSQVIAIDQSDIQEAPVQTTADLLRRVPQVVTLGANPN